MPKHFRSWWDFETFSRSVRTSARFIHQRKVITFLNTLLETSKHRHRLVSEGKYVWRAQLGSSFSERMQDDVVWDEAVPYPRDRMKPRPYAAQEGRVNPKGIPCLYVATDKETAMAEVRPWVGSSVSVGQFRIMRELTLIDFSVGHDTKHVEVIRATRSRLKARNENPAQWGTATLFAIPAFFILFTITAFFWKVPGWVGALYVGASVLCFVVYASDKSAAAADRWRVSEDTLLALGLIGGWPGAIVAQQFLRHKSSKVSFRTKFWATVVANVLGFLVLSSPVRSMVFT